MGDINDDDWRNDLDISGLSLMGEDDSLLLLLLFPDPTTSGTDKEDRGLGLFGDDDDIYNCESSELQKYNLRKSLAWDKAFFTNAGVLEPDELCHMIESNHGGEKRLVLASIQEEDDVKRSTESIKSDCTVETSQGCCVSFEDVRASSQRSPPAVSAVTVPDKTPSTVDDPDSHGKVKPNAIRKRPSIRAQGLGKVTNKPVAAKGHSTSMSRPSSTGVSKSVRASVVDVNKTKQGEPLTISRRVRSIVSKPALRSSSVASKNELTSSCSSSSSSNSLVNAASRAAASKLIGGRQSRVSPLSASISSTYKPRRLPSNASAAFLSASVEYPRAAGGKGKKKTISPAIDDDDPMPDQQGAKHDGTAVSSASVTKPTGLLRMNESTTSSSRTKSRLIQESTKGRSSSRLNIVSASPKLTSKTYSKVSAEERLNGGR